MHTPLHTAGRFALAVSGLVVAGSLAVGSPAFAVVDLAPNAVLTSTSGCDGDTFELDVTLSNPGGGASATFVVDAGTGKSAYDNLPVQVAADDEDVWNFAFVEDFAGYVHITSQDADPAIDFLFEITPDCVPDDEVTTTEVVQIIPTGLPETGSTKTPAAALALGLLVAGGWMIRLARRAH